MEKRGPGRPRKNPVADDGINMNLKGVTKIDVAEPVAVEDPDEMDASGNPTAPKDDPEPAKEDAVSRMANAVERFVNVQSETAPAKKIPWSRYVPKTVFNPSGSKRRILERRCYQNDTRMFIPLLHDEEISLLNQLKPGTYIDGMVTVHEKINGQNLDLHIRYNTGKNHVMENAQQWRSLTELLRRCITEGPTDPEKLARMRSRRRA